MSVLRARFAVHNARAFVDPDGETGPTYYLLPSAFRYVDGRYQRDALGPIRARGAIAMAGPMSGALLEDRTIGSAEELLVSEQGEEPYKNSLEAVFAMSLNAFDGDSEVAVEWLKAALPGMRARTLRILRWDWSPIKRRALQLDEGAAAS
jgi:hypothetical protein